MCKVEALGWSIIVCDTPGIGDTGGATFDIAKTLGIPIALEKCKSVKPILLLNWKTI